MPFQFSESILRRTRLLKDGHQGEGPVLYWMSREQREDDSWPLLAAADAAASLERPLLCIFCFAHSFSYAQERHYSFLIKGLEETSRNMRKHNKQMKILYGDPGATVASLTSALDAALVIVDFDPYPEKQPWRNKFLERVALPVYEVDGHNIIPAWIASPKKEYNAATFRRKVRPLLDSFLEEYPPFPELPPTGYIETPFSLTLEDMAARITPGAAKPPFCPTRRDLPQPALNCVASWTKDFMSMTLEETIRRFRHSRIFHPGFTSARYQRIEWHLRQ